jgi:hypothetical protein
LVEALVASLGAEAASHVRVSLAACGEAGVELTVESDGGAPELPEKIMRGLAGQLGASLPPRPPGVALLWRFEPQEPEQTGSARVD